MCGGARGLKEETSGSAQSIGISIGIGIGIGVGTAWPAGTADCAKMLPAPRGPAGPAALPAPGTLVTTGAAAALGHLEATSAPPQPQPTEPGQQCRQRRQRDVGRAGTEGCRVNAGSAVEHKVGWVLGSAPSSCSGQRRLSSAGSRQLLQPVCGSGRQHLPPEA